MSSRLVKLDAFSLSLLFNTPQACINTQEQPEWLGKLYTAVVCVSHGDLNIASSMVSISSIESVVETGTPTNHYGVLFYST